MVQTIENLTAELEKESLRLTGLRQQHKSVSDDLSFPHVIESRIQAKQKRLDELIREENELRHDLDLLRERLNTEKLQSRLETLCDECAESRQTISMLKEELNRLQVNAKIEKVASPQLKLIDKLMSKATPDQLAAIEKMLTGE